MKILNDCLIEKCLGCRNTDYGVIRTNGTIGCIRYISIKGCGFLDYNGGLTNE